MLKIRLRRAGGRNHPFYRVVVIDSRKARDSRALEEIGYDGWVTAEMFVVPGNPTSADLNIWRAIEADPTEAARQALDFMRATFQ